jgi:hypothetical protein
MVASLALRSSLARLATPLQDVRRAPAVGNTDRRTMLADIVDTVTLFEATRPPVGDSPDTNYINACAPPYAGVVEGTTEQRKVESETGVE